MKKAETSPSADEVADTNNEPAPPPASSSLLEYQKNSCNTTLILLPFSALILLTVVLLTCYFVATFATKHVATTPVPTISDTGAQYPESVVYTFGFHLLSMLLLLMSYWRFKLQQFRREQLRLLLLSTASRERFGGRAGGGGGATAVGAAVLALGNGLSLVFGVGSCLTLSLHGCVPVNVAATFHNWVAGVCFWCLFLHSFFSTATDIVFRMSVSSLAKQIGSSSSSSAVIEGQLQQETEVEQDDHQQGNLSDYDAAWAQRSASKPMLWKSHSNFNVYHQESLLPKGNTYYRVEDQQQQQQQSRRRGRGGASSSSSSHAIVVEGDCDSYLQKLQQDKKAFLVHFYKFAPTWIMALRILFVVAWVAPVVLGATFFALREHPSKLYYSLFSITEYVFALVSVCFFFTYLYDYTAFRFEVTVGYPVVFKKSKFEKYFDYYHRMSATLSDSDASTVGVGMIGGAAAGIGGGAAGLGGVSVVSGGGEGEDLKKKTKRRVTKSVSVQLIDPNKQLHHHQQQHSMNLLDDSSSTSPYSNYYKEDGGISSSQESASTTSSTSKNNLH